VVLVLVVLAAVVAVRLQVQVHVGVQVLVQVLVLVLVVLVAVLAVQVQVWVMAWCVMHQLANPHLARAMVPAPNFMSQLVVKQAMPAALPHPLMLACVVTATQAAAQQQQQQQMLGCMRQPLECLRPGLVRLSPQSLPPHQHQQVAAVQSLMELAAAAWRP
jgi:hypothetical protein